MSVRHCSLTNATSEEQYQGRNMRQLNKLIARSVAAAKPGFHSDGGNLYFAVDADRRKRWVFRYEAGGCERQLYPLGVLSWL